MPIFQDSDLTPFRDLMADLAMNEPCDIQRKTRTADGLGSSSDTWNTLVTTLALVTIPPANAQIQAFAERLGTITLWQVHLPYAILDNNGNPVVDQFGQPLQVQEGDRLLTKGQIMTVQAVMSPESYSIDQTVIASEMR